MRNWVLLMVLLSSNISIRDADMAQLVEHHLAKVGVAGSNPVVRSIDCRSRPVIQPSVGFFTVDSGSHRSAAAQPETATWPSGKAEACKAFTPGSNPGVASIEFSKPMNVAFIGFFVHIRGEHSL